MSEDLQTSIDANSANLDRIHESIAALNNNVNMIMTSLLENQREVARLNMKLNKAIIQDNSIKPLFVNVGVWVGISIVYMISAVFVEQLPQTLLASMDKITSWFTLISIIVGYLPASVYAYKQNRKKTGYLISGAGGAIFINYFWYIAYNYGGLHPHAAAIGFNSAATLQSIAMIGSAFSNYLAFIYKRLDVNKNDQP